MLRHWKIPLATEKKIYSTATSKHSSFLTVGQFLKDERILWDRDVVLETDSENSMVEHVDKKKKIMKLFLQKKYVE